MDIADIPDQIGKAFKYSLRSPGAFALSLITAMVVFAVAYDLIYGFWYVRLYDAKDAHYGRPYFIGFVLVSLAAPLVVGAWACLRALFQGRRFSVDQIGVAIAPFDVISIDPETLGTASTLHALDIVSTHFFRLVQDTLRESQLAEELTFRFLPQYTKIASKQTAKQYLAKLRATLVIWGRITQRKDQPMEIRFEMESSTQTYEFTRMSIETFPMLPLQYFIFVEAAKAVEQRGGKARSQPWQEQVRKLGDEMRKAHPEKPQTELPDRQHPLASGTQRVPPRATAE